MLSGLKKIQPVMGLPLYDLIFHRRPGGRDREDHRCDRTYFIRSYGRRQVLRTGRSPIVTSSVRSVITRAARFCMSSRHFCRQPGFCSMHRQEPAASPLRSYMPGPVQTLCGTKTID